MRTMVRITEFTDPACPFAFSAEPALLKLRWLYGDGLDWRTRMVVLARSERENVDKGLTTEMLATGFRTLQEKHGMPIDWRERQRLAATLPAATAYVAVREHAPEQARLFLRALRVRTMAAELLDSDATIKGAAHDAGIAIADLDKWTADPRVADAVAEDMEAARSVSPASLALDHKLAGAGDGRRRYTCPSLEFESEDGRRFDAPGFQPVEVYEAAIANLDPTLERRGAPESVEELLDWAGYPLATVEVATVMGIDTADARAMLAGRASFLPVGGDGYWSLDQAEQRLAA
jgi:predicted DsbA family dithiol-disulfide isomerase